MPTDGQTLLLLQAAHAAAGRPSIRELERRTGVSNSVISRALAGVRVPSRSALLALAEALRADGEEWGRLWDAYDTARKQERGQQLAAPAPDRCQVEGCPNKPQGALCKTHQRHKQLYGDPTAGRFSPKVHPATCSIEGCDQPYRALGLCHRHYSRERRTRGLLG